MSYNHNVNLNSSFLILHIKTTNFPYVNNAKQIIGKL